MLSICHIGILDCKVPRLEEDRRAWKKNTRLIHILFM